MFSRLRLKWETASFRVAVVHADGTLQRVRKVSRYRRKTPNSWQDGDVYLNIGNALQVTVGFEGRPDEASVNGVQVFGGLTPASRTILEKSDNVIVVKKNGIQYVLTVHVVRSEKESEESTSPGIYEDEGFYYFEEPGWLGSLVGFFGGGAYPEDYDDNPTIPGSSLLVFPEPCGTGCGCKPVETPQIVDTFDASTTIEQCPEPRPAYTQPEDNCPVQTPDETTSDPVNSTPEPDNTPEPVSSPEPTTYDSTPTPTYESTPTYDSSPSYDSGSSSYTSSSDSGYSSSSRFKFFL